MFLNIVVNVQNALSKARQMPHSAWVLTRALLTAGLLKSAMVKFQPASQLPQNIFTLFAIVIFHRFFVTYSRSIKSTEVSDKIPRSQFPLWG
jgi:hypothetical protein